MRTRPLTKLKPKKTKKRARGKEKREAEEKKKRDQEAKKRAEEQAELFQIILDLLLRLEKIRAHDYTHGDVAIRNVIQRNGHF